MQSYKIPSLREQHHFPVLEKGLSFINENQTLHCEYMFFVWNFKNIDWEHVESDEGKSLFPFFSPCITSWVKRKSDLLVRLGLPWKMKKIWSKDWTKLGSNRCVQIGHDDI